MSIILIFGLNVCFYLFLTIFEEAGLPIGAAKVFINCCSTSNQSFVSFRFDFAKHS